MFVKTIKNHTLDMPSNTNNPEEKEKNKKERARQKRSSADLNNILNAIGQYLGSASLPSKVSDGGIKKNKKNTASLNKKRPISLDPEEFTDNKDASSSQEQATFKEEQIDKSKSQTGSTSSGDNKLPEQNHNNEETEKMEIISDIFKRKDLENTMESLNI